jgi:hypothetical protein
LTINSPSNLPLLALLLPLTGKSPEPDHRAT